MNKNCTLSGLNYNVLNIYDKRLPGSYVDHLIINTVWLMDENKILKKL